MALAATDVQRCRTIFNDSPQKSLPTSLCTVATSEPKLGEVSLRVPRCQLDRQHLDLTKPITIVPTPDSVGVWLLNRPNSLSHAEHALNILQPQDSLASARKLGSSGLELGVYLGTFY